jgi:hypothetical protein
MFGVRSLAVRLACAGALGVRLACAAALVLLSGGCGLDVASSDLFLLTRTGQGETLTLLVNDGGTVRCNGGKARTLPDPLLLLGRDLADELDKDAKANLKTIAGPHSVFRYRVRLPDGTLVFPDTAAIHHVELGRAEDFTARVAREVCGLSG